MSGINPSSSSNRNPPSPTQIQSANWAGSIPIHLSLAPTSLSSASIPPTLHRLVARSSYLHVALRDEIVRLHKFAPVAPLGSTGSDGMIIRTAPPDDDDDVNVNAGSNSRSRARSGSNASAEQHKVKMDAADSSGTRNGTIDDDEGSNINDGDNNQDGVKKKKSNQSSSSSSPATETKRMPICWFEDESSGLALRWHLFTGTLFDLSQQRNASKATTAATTTLPWKIRVHFTSYPTNQILAFDADAGVMQTIERYYMNSLKQALFLQHGSSRVAMNICKADHRKLWDAVVASNCNLYAEVNSELQADIREESGRSSHGGGGGNDSGNEGGGDTSKGGELQNSLLSIPVRVLVDGKPSVQRLCPPFLQQESGNDDKHDREASSSSSVPTTLGDALLKFVPNLFERRSDASDGNDDQTDEYADDKDRHDGNRIVPTEKLTWTIQGLSDLPLSFPIGQIWRSLSYPDHFLYISLVTR
mmetsp:Transcript_5302/g.11525  ORF Transcript_5302/g.11525 Transcript_5302/m.11525 type:complete len:474 (-) Transcript_5302:119-1540(-)|eukprot:CAMPEP_0178724300 /NCGR_PEP_ID=MMETSP0699-20121125/26025_1 /TAXON_ID=265572 /ORGANISM="Extubocellulus spinifer, Strain CCMP396" /LENGTH=473 /DNA_ID=CAMNT_0020375475 /DNA_START=92 /DNA_END=1513 /DNA_ORIENTATION=-